MLLLATIIFFTSLLLLFWIHNQYRLGRTIPVVPPRSPLSLVSVIVPARDEERNIGRCVEALLAQTYPSLEIIVVDDNSTDSTPQILSALSRDDQRLRIVPGRPLPSGWAGKPHALSQGADQARGAWLCFVDADTFAAPQLIASTLAVAEQQNVDLLSILTAQTLQTFWERVLLPLVFTAISVGYPGERVNDPDQPDAIANGQFILIRRETYESVGRHAAIRDSIVEDRDLARMVKNQGYRLMVADGRHLANTRMYTGFREVWEGWTKNIYFGLEGRVGLLALGAFVSLFGALGLPFWLIGSAQWLLQSQSWQTVLIFGQACLLFFAIAVVRARVARAFGISSLYALTFPLGALIFAAMMLSSVYHTLWGKGVTWKGRTYRKS